MPSSRYAVVQIDLETGQRMEFSWRFSTAEEATQKIAELTQTDPRMTYIIKLVPAA